MQGSPVLAARGLRKIHPDGTAALRGVDLELAGGMYGLLGPNGAGKTTLLAILVLALEPTSGELRYGSPAGELDASRTADRALIRAGLGYLPQEYRALSTFSGREYLEHCAALRCPEQHRSARRDRATELLHSVGLDRAAQRLAGTYSGGMMRRLGLAQALIHRPRLLVIDEPTAGLDPEERMRFRNLVAEVAESTAVILSTHIVEDVEATCPRVGVLWAGRLHFDDTPTALLRRAVGRLWLLPEGADLPAGAQSLGLRAGDRGHQRLVHAALPPAGAVEHEPRLEDAYAALLAELGGASAVAALHDEDTADDPAPEVAGA